MLSYVISIIGTHFFADWILQSRKMAENKSVQFSWLLMHVLINTIAFGILLLLFDRYSIEKLSINAITHGIIDWNIWKFYKLILKYRIKEEQVEEFTEKNLYAKDYWFYTFIAVDQFLHISIALFLFY